MRFNLCLLLIVGICYILGNACSGRAKEQNTRIPAYRDSTRLVIEGELGNPEVIWANSEVYLKAFERMLRHSRLEDNQIVCDFNAAGDLNISSNIYDYVLKSFELMNKRAKEQGWTIKKRENGYIYESKSEESVPISRAGTAL